MILFDVTKVSGQTHRSGLVRVSHCLRRALSELEPGAMREVVWHARSGQWIDAGTKRNIALDAKDWLLTPELFNEEDRPGISAWLARRTCRMAAVFHDAIPLKFPHITWPQSVARHPAYMSLLARLDRVFAVSEASASDLAGYWRWLGVSAMPEIVPITLGADGHDRPRTTESTARARSREVVMVGIIEPRKDQEAALDAAVALAAEGREFFMTFLGRVNPHFGRPVAKRMRSLARSGFPVAHLEAPADDVVTRHFASARFSLLPSRAEGCGLPVLESLWSGLPVLATALPSIVESAAGGGCMLVAPGDTGALRDGLRRMLSDDALIEDLQQRALSRALPRWADTAAQIAAGLAD